MAMELSPTFLIETANRLGAAAQNVMEVARFGGLETDEEPSPFEVTCEQRNYRLRRYFPALVPNTKAQRCSFRLWLTSRPRSSAKRRARPALG